MPIKAGRKNTYIYIIDKINVQKYVSATAIQNINPYILPSTRHHFTFGWSGQQGFQCSCSALCFNVGATY